MTSNRTDSPSPHLVEKVSDPLGDHKNDHYRDAEADVTSGFHQDYSQAYCHTHNTSCVVKKRKEIEGSLKTSWSTKIGTGIKVNPNFLKFYCSNYPGKNWHELSMFGEKI